MVLFSISVGRGSVQKTALGLDPLRGCEGDRGDSVGKCRLRVSLTNKLGSGYPINDPQKGIPVVNTSEKYDRIGTGYNDSRTADPYLVQRLYSLLVEKSSFLGNGMQPFLDVGCGTGNYTSALAKKGVSLVGLDPSMKMLSEARLKSEAISWVQGKAESMPFGNDSMAGALATLTLHHWEDLRGGFGELARVLVDGGRFVVLTATPEQMRGYWLNHYFPEMLAKSIEQMPGLDEVESGMGSAGFRIIEKEKYFVRTDLRDLFLYAGKHNPGLYLDERVRKGISSFADLANAREVEVGLGHLAADIESGKVLEIIQEYANERGDYLFLVAENSEKAST